MSDFFHGVRTQKKDYVSTAPIVATSGIPFVVGSAPVHQAGGKVNEPVLCKNYDEAVAALGYSDDWANYDLCEVMYSHFKLYGVGPVVFVNVFDPAKAKKTVAAADYPVKDKQVKLPGSAIISTVKVLDDDEEAYELGTDYDVFYDGDYLIVEILDGGHIAAATSALTVAYDEANPAAVTKEDVIGGFDTTTKTYSGFELIDQVYPRFLVVPDLLLAPKWSGVPEVAAVMAAKAERINGLLHGRALIDVDSSAVRYYGDVAAWKEEHGVTNQTQILMWPMVAYDGKIFHLSTQAAGLMAQIDTDNDGCPCDYPSNKALKATSTVLADGTEVVIDLAAANNLNGNGVCTALNFIGGFRFWGNYTAIYPTDKNADVSFIAVVRMFDWVQNSLILSYWGKVDERMTRRLVDSILDSINIWLNSLVAESKLLGARVEMIESENPTEDLMAGIVRFHLYMTPASPAQEIDFTVEYDAQYVSAAFGM